MESRGGVLWAFAGIVGMGGAYKRMVGRVYRAWKIGSYVTADGLFWESGSLLWVMVFALVLPASSDLEEEKRVYRRNSRFLHFFDLGGGGPYSRS